MDIFHVCMWRPSVIGPRLYAVSISININVWFCHQYFLISISVGCWHTVINGCVYCLCWHTFLQYGTRGGPWKFSHHTFNYHYEAEVNVFLHWQLVHTPDRVWLECGISLCTVIISFNSAWKILWKRSGTQCSCILCSFWKCPLIWMLVFLWWDPNW